MTECLPTMCKALGSISSTDWGGGEGGVTTTNLAKSAKLLLINESYNIVDASTTETEIPQSNFHSLGHTERPCIYKGWKKAKRNM